jgi:hypothetical protein
VEHPVSVSLRHLSVNVETAESKFCDLFGQKFNSLSGVAEDDGLIDLKLREQGVQAVNLKKVDFKIIRLPHNLENPGLYPIFEK